MRSEPTPRRLAPWALAALALLTAGCFEARVVGGGYLQGDVTAWRTSGLMVDTAVGIDVHLYMTGDGFDRNLRGRPVVLEIAGGSAEVVQQPEPTDDWGWTSGAITASSAGTVTVRAYAEPEGLPQVALPELTLEITDQLTGTLVLDPMRVEVGLPVALASGYLSRSDLPDLVVADGSTSSPRLLVLRGTCTFPDDVRELAQPGAPLGVAAGDFDGDGLDEAAIARMDGAVPQVALVDATSDGLVQTDERPLASVPLALAAGGLAGGPPDRIVAAEPRAAGGGQLEVYDPATRAVTSSPAAAPTALAAGRIDADDFDDLVVMSAGSTTITLVMGGEVTRTTTLVASGSPVGAALGDLDGDGDTDLAVVTASVEAVAGSLELFLQDAPVDQTTAPTFTAVPPQPLDGAPGGVAVADLNYDSTPDVAVVLQRADGGRLLVFLQQPPLTAGAAVLVPAPPLPVPGSPTMLAVGDWTDDGFTDVAVGSAGQPLTVFTSH